MYIKAPPPAGLAFGNALPEDKMIGSHADSENSTFESQARKIIHGISHELYSQAAFNPSFSRVGSVCYRMINGFYKDMLIILSHRQGKSVVQLIMATKEQYQQFLLSINSLKYKLTQTGCIDNLEIIYGPENLQQNMV
ncbi:hypothetical protein L8P27_05055 [Enterobacter asburiae]|uniref:hypothetical protein n=1 Tax=Enterobacter asburiae TaxID=61645 RepID=UPI0020046B8A|nr:hypothetical protein [Enterobacter asburiae]MCK7227220.1 hypothetical protein [Enterobacter asburiae]